jgi:ligand-binding sensor domain-containing protein
MKWKTGRINRPAICLAVFAFFALTGCGAPAAVKKSTATILVLPSFQPSATAPSTPTATLVPEKTWKTYGPESGLIHTLALDPSAPSTLYAGTEDAGVFKSTDGGGEWTAVNGGLTASNINALAVDPRTAGTLFAGTDDGRIFRSTNGGDNWLALNNGLTANQIKAVAIDPVTPTTLYAGTDVGIFVSINEGVRWDSINHGLLDQNVDALVIDPAAPATLYAGTIGEGV